VKHSRGYRVTEHPELAEFLLDFQPPLEAQLIDLTDEIAYNTADLDDGYEARILSVEQVRAGVSVFHRYYREIEEEFPEALERLRFNEALKRVLNRFVTDLWEHTAARVRLSGVRTLDDVRNYGERLAAFSPEVEHERQECKQFLSENLYSSAALAPEKEHAERVVTELFHHWLACPEELPENHREKAAQETLPRVVCDYIAGMTDNYILEQHAKANSRH